MNPALPPYAQAHPPGGTDPLRAAAQVRELLYARLVSHALTSMAEFRVADHLASGPLHVSVLADRAQVDGEALYRMLRALVAFGIVVQESPRMFALTPLGHAMRSDAPGTAYPTAALIGEVMGPAWNELSSVLSTGKAAFPEVFGGTFYSYLENELPSSSSLRLESCLTGCGDLVSAGWPGSRAGAAVRASRQAGCNDRGWGWLRSCCGR